MDQENTLNFQALRAKFQDEEVLQKQPKIKPALPDKPQQVRAPHSPPYYLPAGARPSLLASINQSLEAKTSVIPRVVFKDDKKESKMPLIQTNSKEEDKSEAKVKAGKDKPSKSTKAKSDDASSDPKRKKESTKDKRFSLVLPTAPKDNTAELVPATAPPKSTAVKKGFMGFKKSKRDSVEISPSPILDSPSPDIPGPAPLIPVSSGFDDATLQTDSFAPKPLLLDIPALPYSSAAMDAAPHAIVPDIPNFSPPPAFIPETPAFKLAAPESKTRLEPEPAALPTSRPASQVEIPTSPPSAVSTPFSSLTTSSALPVVPVLTPPVPEPEVVAGAEALKMSAAATPPSPVSTTTFLPPSPETERPVSAISALERAEDMSPGKRTPPGDQRVFNALEKARKKTPSPLINLVASDSIIVPLEEQAAPRSPTLSLPDLPPVDYEDRAGSISRPTPAQVNGLDHAQASPLLEGITEEGPEAELLLVPPPTKTLLPDRSSLGPPPERPPSISLSEFTAPLPVVGDNPSCARLPVSAEVPEPEAPVFSDVAAEVHAPNLPLADFGNNGYVGPDAPDGQTLPGNYEHGRPAPVAEAPAASDPGEEHQDLQALAGSEGEVVNELYESSENVYEDVSMSATKKKGKPDGGKKRKGPPKNPYVEATQLTNEEKTKTGRFGKSEKKAPAEGIDEKELKKKEKQRLEKEKKELKEKQEREKKEQREKEKKKNEMKKKFKVTGHEEAMYQAKVIVTTKGGKSDLPVKDGDMVSIIRTTNCPKGKWLARDSGNNYGYVAVERVELDIREMVELGRKTTNNRMSGSHMVDGDVPRTDSRASNHYPQPSESFSDDSEEWAVDDDDDDVPSAATDSLSPAGHSRTFSMPSFGNKDLSINHQHSYSDISANGPQAQNEALQKLTTFFQSAQPAPPAASAAVETGPALEAAVKPADKSPKDLDFEDPEMLILPPPDLYA